MPPKAAAAAEAPAPAGKAPVKGFGGTGAKVEKVEDDDAPVDAKANKKLLRASEHDNFDLDLMEKDARRAERRRDAGAGTAEDDRGARTRRARARAAVTALREIEDARALEREARERALLDGGETTEIQRTFHRIKEAEAERAARARLRGARAPPRAAKKFRKKRSAEAIDEVSEGDDDDDDDDEHPTPRQRKLEAEAAERRKLKRKAEEEDRERKLALGRERLRRDRIECSVRGARRREAEVRERRLLVAESLTLALHAAGEAAAAAGTRRRPRRRRWRPRPRAADKAGSREAEAAAAAAAAALRAEADAAADAAKKRAAAEAALPKLAATLFFVEPDDAALHASLDFNIPAKWAPKPAKKLLDAFRKGYAACKGFPMPPGSAALRTISGLDLGDASVKEAVALSGGQIQVRMQAAELRIQGDGFGASSNVALEFVPPLTGAGGLRSAPIYDLNVTDTALVLGLKKGMKWPLFESAGADGTTLFLSSIKKGGGSNLLEGPVPVAKIIPPPTVVKGDDKIIYTTGTTKFLINGTGFRDGMKLTFDPPLVENVDYATNVRSGTAIQVLLKTGRKWRGEPGPLKLRRIDVGGGALRVDPKYGGVTVAEVQADLGGHGVYAEPTGESQFVYQSAKSIKLRWGNGIKGRGVNYTTASFDENGVVLERLPGSAWKRNPKNLPGPLVLLSADAGTGFVAMGATEARKGVRVATVFEDPAVTAASGTSVYRTHTAQLWIKGRGFVKAGARLAGGYVCEGTEFTFEPPLAAGEDVLVSVVNRTHALLRLREGKAWAADAGRPLKITAIKSGPMGAFPGFKPVVVAQIAPDAAFDHPSGMSVIRSNHQIVYRSPGPGGLSSITVTGAKLDKHARLVFEPPLVKGVDYELAKVEATALTLALVEGKAWRPSAGPLVLKELHTPITETTTKRVSIRGAGFDADGVEVTLEPTWAAAYRVEAVYDDEIVLVLNEGKAWTPTGRGVKFKMPAGGAPLVVTQVSTAAGEYVFRDAATGKAKPVQVATIVGDDVATDRDGSVLTCDDSCAWALDGVCDDGSQTPDGGGGGAGYGYGYDYAYGDYGYGEARFYDDALFADGEALAEEYRYAYEDDAYGYAYFYGANGDDVYGYYADDFGAPACDRGTDCTDCGGSVLDENGQLKFWDDAGDEWYDDDGEWFDDDAEEWWDDDYDFGDEWGGFADDDAAAVGIIQSSEATKKPHSRHSGKHEDTHWFHKRKRNRGDDDDEFAAHTAFVRGALSVASVVALGLLCLAGCVAYARQIDDKPDADPCDPCFKALGVGVTNTLGAAQADDLAPMLGVKASKD
ncbi:hypothetical protein JL720_9237 [Aureococcus anophagefferens]|nr:hypothetical protein JL720_9237 [Aureococcus anophagefferens]